MTKSPFTRSRSKLVDSEKEHSHAIENNSLKSFCFDENEEYRQEPNSGQMKMREYERQAELKTRNMSNANSASFSYDTSGPIYSSSTTSNTFNTFSQSTNQSQESLTLGMQQLLNNMSQPADSNTQNYSDNTNNYLDFSNNATKNSFDYSYNDNMNAEFGSFGGLQEDGSHFQSGFDFGGYNEDIYNGEVEGGVDGYKQNKQNQKIHQKILYQQVHNTNNIENQFNQLNQHQHQHQHHQHHQNHQHQQNIERIDKIEHIHNHQNFGSLFKSVVLQLPEHLLKLAPSLLKSSLQTALPALPTKTGVAKRKTRSRGTYKRSHLSRLLEDETVYRFIDNTEEFDINVVNYIEDYKMFNGGYRTNQPHEILKNMGFGIGSYSQSDYFIKGKQYFLKQARCRGGTLCSHCNISYVSNTRICQVVDCKRRLRKIPCSITVYYLYPAISINRTTDNNLSRNINNLLSDISPLPNTYNSSEDIMMNDSSTSPELSAYTRILVFIPDDGEAGHSHPLGTMRRNTLGSNFGSKLNEIEHLEESEDIEHLRPVPIDKDIFKSLKD